MPSKMVCTFISSDKVFLQETDTWDSIGYRATVGGYNFQPIIVDLYNGPPLDDDIMHEEDWPIAPNAEITKSDISGNGSGS